MALDCRTDRSTSLMEYDDEDAAFEDSDIVLPREGIREVTKIWSGDGNLIELLAMAYDNDDCISWSSEEIRQRSNRILLGKLQETILMLPSSLPQWEKYLPLDTYSDKRLESRLHGKILWSETRRRQDWPPQEYVVQIKRRNISTIAITALLWLAEQLSAIADSVSNMSPILTKRVRPHIDALTELTGEYAWDSVPDEPDRFELHALRSSGQPWKSVSEAVSRIIASKRSPEVLAFELLEADTEMKPSLFHLTTFGYLISALRLRRFSIVSEAILHGSRNRPQIRAIHPNGETWELWYEARRMRSQYGVRPSAYKSAVEGINYSEKSFGYDVLLIRPEKRALILECKWSGKPEYVGRQGFHQASSYALDARNGLAKEVWSFVVGPEEIVPRISMAKDLESEMAIVLGSTPVCGLAEVLDRFLAAGEKGQRSSVMASMF